MQILINRTVLILASGFRLLNTLSLMLAALLIILTRIAAIISAGIELNAPSIRPVSSSPVVSCIPW